jgi:hypothetical protein
MGGSVLTLQSLKGVMDRQEKSPTMGGYLLNQTRKSQVEQQGCPSDQQNQPHEVKKHRRRLDVPNECIQPLHELKKDLDFRSKGAAVGWILPSQTKRLKELTKELGYEKGGHTLYWLISMATKPMLELNKLLGLENSSKAIEWLLKQSIVDAIRMKEIPTTSSSAMNILAQIQQKQFQTPTSEHPGGTRDRRSSPKQQFVLTESILNPFTRGSSTTNHSVHPRPLQNVTGSQFQSSIGLVGEKQKHNQFSGNSSSGLQEGQATDRNRCIVNLPNSLKRKAIEAGLTDHRGNQLRTPYTTEPRENQAIIPGGKTTPVQGLSKTINGVNVRCEQVFQIRYPAGIPIDIQVQNRNILSGDKFLQNHGNQYFDPRAKNQVFINVSVKPVTNQGIVAHNEFENIHDCNQYQNQGRTEMGGAHGGHEGQYQSQGGTPSIQCQCKASIPMETHVK